MENGRFASGFQML